MNWPPGPLLVITDRQQTRLALDEIASAVARGGGRWLLLRDKDLPVAERANIAARLAVLAGRLDMHLSISSDVLLAAECGASVHLQSAAAISAARQRCGKGALIGVSAHDLDEAAAAAGGGADYVTLSPIFPSRSKPGYGPALGTSAIAAAAKLGIPVFALGGIDEEDAAACFDFGAAGIAVMGEVMRSAASAATVKRLLARCRVATSEGIPTGR